MKLSKEFIAMFREEAKKAQWEINRWNGKSIDDLVVDYLERKELKPEDFRDVVVLTVKEAKEIAEKLKDLSEGFFLQTGNIDSRAIEWEICLIGKIEQAEKCNE